MIAGGLFSGAGGLDLGLARAGWEHAFLCEIIEYRRRLLAHHFPGVRIYDDVHNVREPRGAVSLLAGGFPCTDLSLAGRRRGLAGERSSLFFEFARVADDVRPDWLLIENVPGLLSSPGRDSREGPDRGGADFAVVLGTLADLGYGVAWRTLDSRHFGVPQRRRRVFILAHLCESDTRAGAERAGRVLGFAQRCERHSRTRRSQGEDRRGAGDPEDGFEGDGESSYYVEGAPNATLRANGVGGSRVDKQPLVVGPVPSSSGGGRRLDADHLDHLIPAVTAKWAKGSGGPSGDEMQNLIPFAVEPERGQGTDIIIKETDLSPSLGVSRNERGLKIAAIAQNQRGELRETDVVDPLAGLGGKPGQGYAAIRYEDMYVRRLTPLECERLQGFPDNWTDPYGEIPKTARYAAIGDAVTVNVAEWLGGRILADASDQ